MLRIFRYSLFLTLSLSSVAFAQESDTTKTQETSFRVVIGPAIDINRAIFSSGTEELLSTNIHRSLRLGLDIQTGEKLFSRVAFQSTALLTDSKFQGVDYEYSIGGSLLQFEQHYLLPLLEKHNLGVFAGGQYLVINEASQSYWTGTPLNLIDEGMQTNGLGICFGAEIESRIGKSIQASFYLRQAITLGNFEIEGNQNLSFNSTSVGVVFLIKR